jgi:alginate production protein
VFVPSSRIAPFDSVEPDDTRSARAYAGINELWIQYGGFTSYPGEAVRIGRQHIRQTDSGWWDQDTDAVRWILDTTLLEAEVGAARTFSMFRTDGVDVPASRRNRTYYFARLAAAWYAENKLGLRVAHVTGGERSTFDDDPTLTTDDERLTWIGLYAENGFYDILRGGRALSYASQINYLTGRRALFGVGDDLGTQQTVGAWQASAELRWRPRAEAPLQMGAGYTYSQGGTSGSRSHQYRQTGMQSNSSYFTGTRTLIGRYNETLQAELGNLLVGTAFVSFDFANNDASLIATMFRREDGTAPIITRNVTAVPVNSSRDIGKGVDLVLTHYFARDHRRQRLLDRGDAFTALQRRSLVSLRASLFDPGEAYGPDARIDYRVLLEGTLWID